MYISIYVYVSFGLSPTSSCRPQQHPALQELYLHVIPGVISNERIAWQKE